VRAFHTHTLRHTESTNGALTGSAAPVTAAPPARSRSGLAAFAWFALVARSVLSMLVGFIVTPYLLRFLGAERLGALRASQQWGSYLPFLYVGLGPSLVVMLLKPASRGDLEGTAAVLKSGMAIVMRQTLTIVLPAGLVLAWFMPELVGVSAPLGNELRWGVLIGMVGVFLAPLEVFRSALACLQLGYLVNIALSVQSFAIAGFAVWFAWLGWGLQGQFVANVIGLALFSALSAYFAIYHLRGHMSTSIASIDREELWGLRWPMLLTGIGGQMNLLTDYIVVSLVADPAAVTTFSITQRLVTVLGSFVSSFSDVSWAGLAELRASGANDLFESRVLELIRLFLGMGLCLLVTFAAFNQHFVRLWVGQQYYGGDALTILTAAQTLVVGFFMLFAWCVDVVAGHTRDRVVVAIPGAFLNVVLSVILGERFGLYGVTLATVVAYVVGEGWYTPYLFCRLFGISGRVVVREVARSCMLAVPWILGVWWLAHGSSLVGGWASFFTGFSTASILAMAYVWLAILRSEDRANWRGRARAMLKDWYNRGPLR
jgi:O-antigen/teichoic acid export membrane protein